MTSSRALTIPELLFIIAVLAILAILLRPSTSGTGLDAAPKAQAKNDVTQIATAIVAFQTEYGRLPNWTNSTVSGDLLAVLTGSDKGMNPRQIVFIEVQPAKKGKSGIANGTFIDPWGAPYRIALDSDGDGMVRAGTNNVEIQKFVAVWNEPSLGKRDSWFKPFDPNRRYVTSWDEPRRPNYPQSQKPSASPAQNP